MADMTEKEKEEKIKKLKKSLPSSTIATSEENLKKYSEDYEKYVTAQDKLNRTSKVNIGTGMSDIVKGNNNMPKYASGNMCRIAMDFFAAVYGMFSSSLDGIDSIIEYMTADMKLLDEQYIEEYKTYSQAIEDYNDIAKQIRNLGGSTKNKEKSITKSSLA